MPSLLSHVALVVALSGSIATCAQTPIIIGVLEQSNYHSIALRYPEDGYAQQYDWTVRALFQKDGSDWVEANDSTQPKAIAFYAPGSMKYIPAKALPPDYAIGGAAFYQLRGKSPVTRSFPRVVFEKDDIRRYAVLCTRRFDTLPVMPVIPALNVRQAIQDTLTNNRQLMRGNLPDGSRWVDGPILSYLDRLPGTIRDGIAAATAWSLADGNTLVSATFQDSPMNHIGKAFTIERDGFREDNGHPPRLGFLVRPSGDIKTLFADFDLLGCGDYDGDGQVEFLCFYSRFNHYGYALFYADWTKMAVTGWSYH